VADKTSEKLVIFGAGKIGRSFIGQLFSRGGFEVVFVDIVWPVIEELNRRREYQVVIRGETEETLNIRNVRGLHFSQEKEIIDEVATADLAAVSVGLQGLTSVIPLIAKGLIRRKKTAPGRALDIIIAENIRNGAAFVRAGLKENLPDGYPLDELVGLVETSIGKMVPIMPEEVLKEDILKVYAEPYNTLILDKIAFKNPIPEIEGLAPKENIKAWVDRKLFIHNLGHVSAAYCGFYYYPQETYMYEVLAHEDVRDFTREAMLQSSEILKALYPDEFTEEHLRDHIEDLIARFQNRALGDTVYRVGSDLQRKLSYNDRLLAPFHAGIKLKMPVDKIAKAIWYGVHFRAKDEKGKYFPGDIEFFSMIREKGLKQTLKALCKLDEYKAGIIIKE
jgi:mannitol-1-phosphate 5-dehydrogenase